MPGPQRQIRKSRRARRDPRPLNVVEIVHDLKQPLATIALELHMLDERLLAYQHADLRGAVARVGRNVEYLDRMIHDILDSAAVDAKQFAIARERTELRTLLERVIERAVATRDRSRVLLEAVEPITVSIDPLRIERVVANLLQNALTHAPRSSAISVQLAAVAAFARVSVIDAGPGIDAADSPQLFESVRRGTSGPAREGLGLGLYVSKQIVDAHGGRIGAENLQGTGARFFFELPLA